VQGFTSDQRFKLSEIVEINNDDELQLILISGDTVFMGIFDYDSKEVSDFIKKNTP
jgi:precorrin-6B methylase 1